MNTLMKPLNRHIQILAIIMAGMMLTQNLNSQGWRSRIPIVISNPGTAGLPDFQVQVKLNDSDFDFAEALSDGSDIRFTTGDGTTLIPFWIEMWDQANDTASIWVRVPFIPITGTTIYLYYGNPLPTVPESDVIVERPPSGPYTKHPDNPIVPIGRPSTGATRLLAENIVYDDVTGHYWMVLSNQTVGANVSLVYSDDPTNPDAWYWPQAGEPAVPAAPVILEAIAPHILKHNGRWYIFYGDRSTVTPHPIAVRSSESITGPYTIDTRQVVLQSTEPWELYRVDEPYVFQRNDGKWILMYMGNTDAGNNEQVGYAVADNLLGPYTKFNSDDPEKPDGLCIPLGFGGSFDAGTVADPWVIEHKGVYYIGYTVSPTTSGWSTALASTTDWETFIPHGIILDKGTETNSFRGAVTQIGDLYVFPYTSGNYDMCIATQPVFSILPNPGNNANAVFDFYDDFDGNALDTDKWSLREPNDADQISVGGGFLTLTSASNTNYVRIDGASSFGFNYIGETRARHPNPPAINMIVEYGLAQSVTTFDLRITDNFTSIGRWQRYVMTDFANFGPSTDTDWHVYGIYRESPGTAGFSVDEVSAIVTSGVPTANLRPFLMSFGTNNQYTVDWTRVRKWAAAEPLAVTGDAENLITQWVGTIDNDWNKAGNWTAGVPAGWNVIELRSATNAPVFSGSLEVGSMSSLTVESDGVLTVLGDLTAGGPVTVRSTVASSGSLIVTGNSTGPINFSRQLKAGSEAGSNWHLAAPPVADNSESNTGKISTVYEWSELAGLWTTTDITSALPGRGYNIRQEAGSDGAISFRGPLVDGDVTVAASSPYADAIGPGDSYFGRAIASGRTLADPGGMGWNLLGNPYSSAISVDAFIAANYNATPMFSQFDPNYVALYLFDGTARRYGYLASNTGWPSGLELDETHVQAGQGFFVLAMNDNSQFTFTRAMQEHSTTTPMLKSGSADNRWPGLQLKVAHPAGEVITTVVYGELMTEGVDPGYDIGLFKSGQDIEIYTTLALSDNGVNYTRQALPSGAAETLRIPVGIDYQAGGEVTFSATAVPLGGRRFWLEDRTAGVFTDLSLNSYTVTLPADSYGPGRFYLLASANTPTGTEQLTVELADLRIWTSNGRLIIKGEVSEGTLCGIYDMSGRKLAEDIMTDGELNTVALPAGLHGVILINVTDGVKTVTRKVAIL